ncbi:MAG: rRNA maturation RNase YbeY [Proteobacteria bacterium]|nr:rRNA maturation RNase YbeY [Pseudomonadota bacterium]MCH9003737.1 rRNA maturation RNase YbeY [Pseudomonadota bacterium]
MNVQVDVQVASKDESVPNADDISLWVSRTVAASGRGSVGDVSIRVVDEKEMQGLNNRFRDQDKPTNVLSFPAGEIDGLPTGAELPLGDIVVCAAIVRDEAKQQGKSGASHWAHMIVHGTLHLLGFDHQKDTDAVEMEGLETRILTEHGIANPYGEPPQET